MTLGGSTPQDKEIYPQAVVRLRGSIPRSFLILYGYSSHSKPISKDDYSIYSFTCYISNGVAD